VAYKKKGEYDRAIEDFDASIKLDPTRTTILSAMDSNHVFAQSRFHVDGIAAAASCPIT
jgi:hypothetical protein